MLSEYRVHTSLLETVLPETETWRGTVLLRAHRTLEKSFVQISSHGATPFPAQQQQYRCRVVYFPCVVFFSKAGMDGWSPPTTPKPIKSVLSNFVSTVYALGTCIFRVRVVAV